ncbi:hypothetical protein GJAV_G00145990 [Gymnothorax javanicus]|nr:hypothetical protein GJAV_G00145990 [Gymnothorax javanicus]
MDRRGYGSSGYSSWGGGGGGSSRGSGGYDLYGYKDSMSGGGYGGGSGHMKRGLSGASGLMSTGASAADAVIAKINQRLDMLTQLEGVGSMKGGGRSDRFDQYESYDSRPSSVNPRDLYRSASYGGYGDSPSDLLAPRGGSYGAMGGAYEGSSSFGMAKQRQTMRESSFSGPGWGGGRRSPRRGGFGRRMEPPIGGGGGGMGRARGGHSPGGRGRLPSLLAHRMYPETGPYQSGPPPPGPRDFGAGRAGRQRGRKRPVNRQQMNTQREVQKKRKQTATAGDEPESKMGKTEPESTTDSTNDSAKPSGETSEGKSSTPADGKTEGDALTMQEEITQMKKKLQTKPPPSPAQDKYPKLKKRRGFQERVVFACSVCKFRSLYSDEMTAHMESRFHKDHFRFLSSQLSKPTVDFLQEYLNNKFKKTEERIKQIDNFSAAICQVYKEQDLTRDIGMEHFMKKVEAAHCAACDLFIPMQTHLIQRHIRSPDHNFNRKGMMEQAKRGSLSVARSILNHKVIAKKLESYLKGENPFEGNEKDADDSLMDVSGAEDKSQSKEGEGTGQDGNHAAGEQNDGVEVKMEEEELEGVLGEDCLEGEEEGAGIKEDVDVAGLNQETGIKIEDGAELHEDEEGVQGVLGEGTEGDLRDEEEQGVEGELGDGEEGVEGDFGEDEGVEAEEEEGIEVVEDEEEGVPGQIDENDVAVEEDDDGVVLVE